MCNVKASCKFKDAGTGLHGHTGADGKTAKVHAVVVTGVAQHGPKFDSYAPVTSLKHLLTTIVNDLLDGFSCQITRII